MEPFRVYGKTELGATALTSARGALASSARQLLILVDGQRSVAELGVIFGADSVDQLLPQLERQGFVQFLRDAEGGGTPSRFVPLRSDAVETPPLPSDAAPAAPRNRLAIAVLALGVLSASAAIWWFLGPARNPAPPATVEAEAPPPAMPAPPADAAAPAPAPAPVPPAPEIPPSPEPRSTEPITIENRSPVNGIAAAPARAEPRTPPSASTKSTVATTAPAVTRGPAPVPARAPAPPPAAASAPAAVPPTPVTATVTVSAPPPVRTVVATETPASTTPTAAAVAPDASRPAAAGARGAVAVRPAAPAAPAAKAVVVPVLHPRERTMPELSRRARRAGIDSGELVVRLHITDGGTVEAVDVVKANPPQVYDNDVQQTLLKWTFDPPGVPVITKVEFSFKP